MTVKQVKTSERQMDQHTVLMNYKVACTKHITGEYGTNKLKLRINQISYKPWFGTHEK